MEHTEGKLHRHGRDIHIERSENGQVVEHTCIAVANDTTHLPIVGNMNHLVECWNSHDALLAACKDALPLITGERIAFDAFPPEDELTKALAKDMRETEQKLKAAIKQCE